MSAEGEIGANTPASFQEFIKAHAISSQQAATVVLNSPGGSLLGGLALGKLFRQNGFATHVGAIYQGEDGQTKVSSQAICASACAYAFLGGGQRSLETGSKYGLHQLSTASLNAVSMQSALKSIQSLIAFVNKYVIEMGVSSELVTIATSISSSSIDWIDNSTLLKLGAVNSSGLNAQQDWKFLSPNQTVMDVSVVDRRGVREHIIILARYCDLQNSDGNADLSVSRSEDIPKSHAIRDMIYSKFDMRVLIDGEVVTTAQNNISVFNDHPTISGFKFPVSKALEALKNNAKITLEVEVPEEAVDIIGGGTRPLPINGLQEGLERLLRMCKNLR